MTNQEAIKIGEDIIINMRNHSWSEFENQDFEAIEKLIQTAKAIRWVNLMGDLSVLIDLDPNRYKINKEDWLAERDVPLEYFLDKLYDEVINNDERRV